MDHSLNLATELVGLTYQVTDAPKNLTFTAPDILPNVQICIMCYYNGASAPWSVINLRSDQTSVAAGFQQNGYVKFYAMLKPQVYPTQVYNGTPFNVVDIGLGDGTGTDFDGVMGARISISFIAPTASNVTPYRGTPTSLMMNTDYLHTQGYLLDIHDAAFDNHANTYQAIQVQVTADAHNKKQLEQMVWIHLFDNNGNLLGVVDTLDNTIINNTCNINLANGFQMMALIQGQKNPNSSNQFTFAIGDPKTDAVVSITEVD